MQALLFGALLGSFLMLCNDYASKKRYSVAFGLAAITFLFIKCINTKPHKGLYLCNVLFHKAIPPRLLKISYKVLFCIAKHHKALCSARIMQHTPGQGLSLLLLETL